MKQYLLLAAAMIGAAQMFAQQNLIQGCMLTSESDMNNKEAFYSVWRLYDKDGNEISPENAPYSSFTQVLPSWQVRMESGYSAIYSYSNKEGIVAGDDIILMDFSNSGRCNQGDYNYSYPIDVPADGEYELSGKLCIVKYYTKANNLMEASLAQRGCWLIATADETISAKNIGINDKVENPYVYAQRQSDGEDVTFGFAMFQRSESNSNGAFSINIKLTTKDKYLTLYMPSYLMALADLKLIEKGGMDTHQESIIADFEENSTYYDLQGRDCGKDYSGLSKGVYVERRGGESRKILK